MPSPSIRCLIFSSIGTTLVNYDRGSKLSTLRADKLGQIVTTLKGLSMSKTRFRCFVNLLLVFLLIFAPTILTLHRFFSSSTCCANFSLMGYQIVAYFSAKATTVLASDSPGHRSVLTFKAHQIMTEFEREFGPMIDSIVAKDKMRLDRLMSRDSAAYQMSFDQARATEAASKTRPRFIPFQMSFIHAIISHSMSRYWLFQPFTKLSWSQNIEFALIEARSSKIFISSHGGTVAEPRMIPSSKHLQLCIQYCKSLVASRESESETSREGILDSILIDTGSVQMTSSSHKSDRSLMCIQRLDLASREIFTRSFSSSPPVDHADSDRKLSSDDSCILPVGFRKSYQSQIFCAVIIIRIPKPARRWNKSTSCVNDAIPLHLEEAEDDEITEEGSTGPLPVLSHKAPEVQPFRMHTFGENPLLDRMNAIDSDTITVMDRYIRFPRAYRITMYESFHEIDLAKYDPTLVIPNWDQITRNISKLREEFDHSYERNSPSHSSPPCSISPASTTCSKESPALIPLTASKIRTQSRGLLPSKSKSNTDSETQKKECSRNDNISTTNKANSPSFSLDRVLSRSTNSRNKSSIVPMQTRSRASSPTFLPPLNLRGRRTSGYSPKNGKGLTPLTPPPDFITKCTGLIKMEANYFSDSEGAQSDSSMVSEVGFSLPRGYVHRPHWSVDFSPRADLSYYSEPTSTDHKSGGYVRKTPFAFTEEEVLDADIAYEMDLQRRKEATTTSEQQPGL